MLGKRLYRTSMLSLFRLMILAVVIFFVNDFYLETITNSSFLEMVTPGATRLQRIMTFFGYHLKYPIDLINLLLVVFTPAVYFAFIRGVRFHEKGFIFNRGVPFLDSTVLYGDVKSYKLLHPKQAIWVTTKAGESFIIADNDIERVIAILDQHNIHGDLAVDQYVKLVSNYKRFVVFLITAFFIIFAIRKLGAFLSNL